MLGYAIYAAGAHLARADVLTCEVAPSRDLGDTLTAPISEGARQSALNATATLIAALSRAGARHHSNT